MPEITKPSIFSALKTQQELEARAYEKGFKDGAKQRKKHRREIKQGIESIYKFRYDQDTVGNEADHLLNIIKREWGDL